MLHRKLAVLALLLLPAAADAQRRTRGEKTANWDEIEKSSSGAPRFSTKDVEEFSAIKIVVEKRKDLKLNDDQAKTLRDLSKQEDEALKPRMQILDSLRLAMRVRPGEDADLERARTSIARQEVLRVVGEIRTGYDSTFQAGLPVLDETQRKSAMELVERERTKREDELREKLGGGGRGPGVGGATGGGGGRRGRP
ncbi:MAG TPA: hypothetical protein VEB19_11855 [Gemmatimonadaceae bacterium]|nr:hypothetical protein [Gemmatimonadaceae bacterium]